MSATTAPAPPAAPLEEAPASRGKRKLLLIVGLVVLAVGAALWFFVLSPGDEAAAAEAEVVEGAVVPLEPLTTTTGTAALHHARVALALVLSEEADEVTVTERAPLLQDALLREIATMDADLLRSSAGSDQLRTNLTAHAQEVWPDGEVLRVVLTELLVQ